MLRISVRWKRALIVLGLVLSPGYLPACVILSGQRDVYKTAQCGPAQQFNIPDNPGSGLFSGCAPEWNHGLLLTHMVMSAMSTLVVAIPVAIAFWRAKKRDDAEDAEAAEAAAVTAMADRFAAAVDLQEVMMGAAMQSRPSTAYLKYTRYFPHVGQP